jgi:hypothetical protein
VVVSLERMNSEDWSVSIKILSENGSFLFFSYEKEKKRKSSPE